MPYPVRAPLPIVCLVVFGYLGLSACNQMQAPRIVPLNAMATNYYVNNRNGSASDSNAGTNPSLPWLTLGKCASTMVAGDTCTVYAGTYNENVTVPAGGVGAYKTFAWNGSDGGT